MTDEKKKQKKLSAKLQLQVVDRFCRIKSGIRRCDKVLSRVLNAHTHTPKKEKKFQMKIESVIFSDSLNTHFHILN